ncbi:MAG: ATP-binding protein [Pseudomonadota bacterium]
MSMEGHLVDRKSLRSVTGKKANYIEIAKDCVAFANAQGGKLLIGIEDGELLPPSNQRINPALLDVIRKRINENTVGVVVVPQILAAENGGEYLEVGVRRGVGVASTSDGRYFIRVADSSRPVVGDEVMRLANERAAFPWETMTTLQISRSQIDPKKLRLFSKGIRASDRVKASVKAKTDEELLDHYLLVRDAYLTHLGILCVGRREDRARLGTAPVIQFIKYDETGAKVSKITWDDYNLTPMEMIEAVWNEVPDWKEGYEIRDGLYPQNVPHYDEVVIRELLTNALVHRPYTQRGDIFINLYPDRLEIVNPGLFPLGVTPRNILHVTVRRNEHLARLFHDLKLMEREGSGYDLLYEALLSKGKLPPEPVEGPDRVEVTVRKRILNTRIIEFITKANEYFQLSQKEKICLGLLAQHEALTAIQLTQLLELKNAVVLHPWLDRLTGWNLVISKGKAKGMLYFVNPDLLRKLEFRGSTTLRGIEKHRLRELVLRDLEIYREGRISEIHERIGKEIPRRMLQNMLRNLAQAGEIGKNGSLKHTRYLYTK